MSETAVPSRDELREHLVATRIVGRVGTTRQNNLRNAARMASGDPHYAFGLEVDRPWSHADVIAEMARRVGISPDLEFASGVDTIDPDLCLDALERMRDRLVAVAAAKGKVLVATGHPTGLYPVHRAVAAALSDAGCELLMPGDGAEVIVDDEPRQVCFIAGVAVLASTIDLLHTHSPEPMRTLLAAGGPRPDLVVADHGWAGAAGQAGLLTVGFADCNDPALFVGEAEGKVAVAVPLDDNVLPSHYDPMTAYLLAGLPSSPAP